MLRHYLTMTIAVLKRRPFYTAISLFGISFTLLVLMVISAMADHMLAPMPPESRQARMIGVHSATMFGPNSTWNSDAGYLLFDRYAKNLPGVEELTLFTSFQTVTTYLGDQRISSNLKRTDAAFWRVFDFTFIEGGPYGKADVDEARFVAVISRESRQRLFGGADGARQELRGRRADVPRRRRRRERLGHAGGPLRRHLRADDDGQERRLQAADDGRLPRRRPGPQHRATCRSSARSSTRASPRRSCRTRATPPSSPRSRRPTTRSPGKVRGPTARARSGRAPS